MEQSPAARLAQHLYPYEEWVTVSDKVFLAASRKPVNNNQEQIVKKELGQAAILEKAGHTVYLIPEGGKEGEKYPDAVVDNLVMEFKTITCSAGNRTQNL